MRQPAASLQPAPPEVETTIKRCGISESRFRRGYEHVLFLALRDSQWQSQLVCLKFPHRRTQR